MSAPSRVMYELQRSPRPLSTDELAERLGIPSSHVRQALARIGGTARLWRGTGRRWGWGGPTVAWWWTQLRADQEGLGQVYQP